MIDYIKVTIGYICNHINFINNLKKSQMKVLLVIAFAERNPSANFVYTGCGGRHATTSTRQERVKSGKRSESASSEDDIR